MIYQMIQLVLAMAAPEGLFVAHTHEHSLFSARSQAECTPNATHGCLDTTPYNYANEVS